MKTREEREKQLREIEAGPKGSERIQEIFRNAIFVGGSVIVPSGKSGIEAICPVFRRCCKFFRVNIWGTFV